MNPKKYLVCEGCGITYHPIEARKSNRFCSRVCAAQHRIPHPKGYTNGGSFQPQQPPWNDGLKGYRLGHPVSVETRNKIGMANFGANGGNWKGGITPTNNLLRRRADVLNWRKSIFERDNYTCQLCGDRSHAGHRIIINAHHIKKVSEHPELISDIENGVTLCKQCHLKVHSKKAELING